MNIPSFNEAWIGKDGTLVFDGHSHFDIAHKYLGQIGDPLHIPTDDGCNPDYYDACYEYMWKNGFGRIVKSNFFRNISIQTSKDYPEFRTKLIKHAKELCKSLNIKELVCDATGRVLWSKDDF